VASTVTPAIVSRSPETKSGVASPKTSDEMDLPRAGGASREDPVDLCSQAAKGGLVDRDDRVASVQLALDGRLDTPGLIVRSGLVAGEGLAVSVGPVVQDGQRAQDDLTAPDGRPVLGGGRIPGVRTVGTPGVGIALAGRSRIPGLGRPDATTGKPLEAAGGAAEGTTSDCAHHPLQSEERSVE
jgi:hypothetical protein